MAYVELHACSAFSFLRGASFPEQLAEVAAELEMPALALLDRNGVYGAQRFSVAAREQDVRPIVGCELTMEDGSVLPVLVENRTGYTNLCSLLTQAHLRSEKGECAVQWNELPEFAEGLVRYCWGAHASRVLVPASRRNESFKVRDGETPSPARESACAPQSSADRAQLLIDTFGRDNVYVEMQRHFLRGEERQQPAALRSGGALRPAGDRDERRAIRAAKRPPGARRLHLHPRAHAPRCRGQIAHAKRRATSEERCRNARALSRSAGSHHNTERLADRLNFLSKTSATSFPHFRCRTGTTWIRSCARSRSSARSSATPRSAPR